MGIWLVEKLSVLKLSQKALSGDSQPRVTSEKNASGTKTEST